MTAALLFIALMVGGMGLRELIKSSSSVEVWPRLSRAVAALGPLVAGRIVRGRGLANSLGLSGRIARAGLSERLSPSSVFAVKLITLGIVGLAPLPLLGLVPGGRFETALATCILIAAFLLPDAVLEALAAKRMRAIGTSLPDWLDLASVRASSGASPLSALSGSAPRSGPLRSEIGMVAAEVECGVTARDALHGLASRVPSRAVAAACVTVDRSRTLGSPFASQLRDQAGRLRAAERRRIVEQGARAAPKIQLVVALLLVPSVLLMIAAGLLANLDSLVTGF